ncbi:serine/threonine protein kinase [Streptomyces sp. NPDC058092]|uniref:serine/threonine protein kinase n=1 Tax=Streptomyces sp. NPDC058092 TaxID=3346336 RepID=UPI0036EF90A1
MSASWADIQPLDEDDPVRLGAYPLIGRLGAGGMGRVYLGRSLTDGGLVAVKTLLAEGEISPVDRRRFAREVKVARRAEGARTARVLGSDPEAERPWLATEYIPAPSLAELVLHAGPLTGTAARWVTRGALEALAELHRHGIVHRDVKPQNLLLPLGGPRLIDFGISHATDLTRTQLTLGTVAFTSPEQARGEPSTTASDMYSIGATLFHLAVGRAPYPPDVEMLPLLTYVAEARVDLTGLPDELGPVVRNCLASDPGDRPQVTDLLERFTFELAEMPTAPDAGGWLPTPWTRIIEAYARRGHELVADPGAVVRAAADGHPVRPAEEAGPPQTRPLTTDWEAAPGTSPHPGGAPDHADRTAAHADPEGTAEHADSDAPHGRGARVFVRVVQTVMAAVLLTLAALGVYGYYAARQAGQPDATDRAFSGMRVGECVGTGLGPDLGWLSRMPQRAPCLADDADWRVVAVDKGGPADRCYPSYHTMPWLHTSTAGTTGLCLERIFHRGECVLGAEPTPGSTVAVTLLKPDPVFATTVSCSDTAPADYAVLHVLEFGPVESGCPARTRVLYRFPDRGKVLCLTPA